MRALWGPGPESHLPQLSSQSLTQGLSWAVFSSEDLRAQALSVLPAPISLL